jgi:hypothetical protein
MRLTLTHCCCRSGFAVDPPGTPRPEVRSADDETPATVATPNGSAHASEAFAWVNRQITWQSLLADLEVMSWLAEGDALA